MMFLQFVVRFYLGFIDVQLIKFIIQRQTQFYTSFREDFKKGKRSLCLQKQREGNQYLSAKNGMYLKNFMVKTSLEQQSAQQHQLSQAVVNQQKPIKKGLKLFSYAFPKRDSPYYLDNLPYFKQQYQQIQQKMKNVNRITFKTENNKKTFNWIKPQPYQYQPSQQSQSEIYSRASTQIKVDHSQMKRSMQEIDEEIKSEVPLMGQFYDIMEQCSYVSSCRSQDIEIEQRIASISNRDNQMRSQQQSIELSNREENVQMFAEQIFPTVLQVENQAAFGPLNIDDLSTNQTLNPSSRSIQMQQADINHIFIENGQNLFENLSEMSTRACMSHNENSVNFNEANNNQLTQEEYNEIIWNAQQNLYLYTTLGNEQLNRRIQNYLNLMLEFKARQTNRNLSKQEREEFWSLMRIIGFSFHSVTFDKMSELVLKYEENQSFENDFEYILIKERIENLKLLSSSQDYQF